MYCIVWEDLKWKKHLFCQPFFLFNISVIVGLIPRSQFDLILIKRKQIQPAPKEKAKHLFVHFFDAVSRGRSLQQNSCRKKLDYLLKDQTICRRKLVFLAMVLVLAVFIEQLLHISFHWSAPRANCIYEKRAVHGLQNQYWLLTNKKKLYIQKELVTWDIVLKFGKIVHFFPYIFLTWCTPNKRN